MASKVEENEGYDEVAEKIFDDIAIHPVCEDEEAVAHREDAGFVKSF